MMSDTTSLGGGGGYGGNKMLSISNVLASMDSAMAAGATQLPSRDIPMEQYPPQQLDAAVRPNYADTTLLEDGPTTGRGRYAGPVEDDDESAPVPSKSVNLEDTYNALQVPIFLAILFVLFQLPIVKKWEYNYIPFAFTSDGNWNVGGIILNSVGFAAVYYIIQRVLAF